MSLSKQQAFRETRRLKAMRLLKSGKNQTEVAAELGVSPAAVSQRVKAARLGETAALEAKPISGRPTKLSGAQLQRLTRMLSEGPSRHGFPTELWTLQRVAELVRRKFESGGKKGALKPAGYPPAAIWGCDARRADCGTGAARLSCH